MSDDLRRLGPALRNLRLRAGYAEAQEFARATGFTKSQVSLWENGGHYPRMDNLFRWLEACRASLRDLDWEIQSLSTDRVEGGRAGRGDTTR